MSILPNTGVFSWMSELLVQRWTRSVHPDEVCWSLPVWYASCQCQSCLKIPYSLYILEEYSIYASLAVNTSISIQLLKLHFLSAKCVRSWHSPKKNIFIFWQTSCNYHWLFCCWFCTLDCWRRMFQSNAVKFFCFISLERSISQGKIRAVVLWRK